MKNKKLEANLSMAVSKIFSGLNMNALKYLLPLWMSPLTGATLRCTFAAAAFWAVSYTHLGSVNVSEIVIETDEQTLR